MKKIINIIMPIIMLFTISLFMNGCSEEIKVVFVDNEGVIIKTETIEKGMSVTAPTAPSIEGYVFSGWNHELVNIEEDITVAPIYEAKEYTVKFYNALGVVIKEQKVKHGEDAIAPSDCETEGYIFSNEWDSDFTNVKKNLDVYGLYEEKAETYYKVEFYDYDGNTFLGIFNVKEGEASPEPKIPERKGYIFDEWDIDFSNVNSNLIVKATYIKTYEVKFANYNGEIVDTQTVKQGEDAITPKSPTRLGYIFERWDKTYTNVLEDLTVNALFVKDETKVIIEFRDYDETVISFQVVDKGGKAILPENPERNGYDFISWNKDLANLNEDTIIYPNYLLKEIVNVDFDILFEDDAVMLVDEVQTLYTIANIGYHEVTFTSLDTTIATIDEFGVITALKEGEVTIKATIVGYNGEEASIIIYVQKDTSKEMEELLEYFASINEKEVIYQRVTAYGYQDPGRWYSNLYGSVSKYYFDDVPIIDTVLTPIGSNRPGTKKTSIEFITVHDTASMAESATALSHANYVREGGGGTSWGYSVGNDGIYYQIPDDEVTYHAGDGTIDPFTLTDTNVKANGEAIVTIENDYYYINGEKTSIHIPVISYQRNSDGTYTWVSDGVPLTRMYKINSAINPANDLEAQATVNAIKLTTASINDAGLHVVVGENGNYFMGKTYFNGTYKYISNRGGNLNSIGMETMVNQGSDLYKTWHYTAYLCAKLMDEYNLDITRVKPHHFFSGKNCPQTMRENDLWYNLLEMIEAQYNIRTKYADYSIEFISHNPSLLLNNGRVIRGYTNDTTVKYTLVVKNNKTNEVGSITLSSVIPGSFNK